MTHSADRIPQEAAALLREGRKLEAVKLTREKLGLSLKDAKDLCDAWSADPESGKAPVKAPTEAPAPRAALPPGDLPAAAIDALRRGNKIEAIKLHREATGEGLKESKDAVEAWEAAHPELSPTADRASMAACERGAGCCAGRLLLALLALGLIAAAVYFSGVFQ